MAPEMLTTEKNRMLGDSPLYHNRSLDFYHLGALLYEILCGLPPFFSEDRHKMYKDILFSPLHIPTFLSTHCRSLLHSLLHKNPALRPSSATAIKSHPWLSDLDWAKVLGRKLEPPFKPFLTRSNFDPEYTGMNPVLIVEDEAELVALGEEKQTQKAGQDEFLDEYRNRIQKLQKN